MKNTSIVELQNEVTHCNIQNEVELRNELVKLRITANYFRRCWKISKWKRREQVEEIQMLLQKRRLQSLRAEGLNGRTATVLILDLYKRNGNKPTQVPSLFIYKHYAVFHFYYLNLYYLYK